MLLTSHIVALEKCAEYRPDLLNAAIDGLIRHSDFRGNLHSAQILIKPNLISARKGPLACTEGAFIISVVRWFLDHGANVLVGDSPAFGTAKTVLTKLALTKKLEHFGAKISNFHKIRKVRLASGIQAGLAVDALDCDLLVNLPRVKAHAQLGVTLAVKNYFGCLVGMRKPWWHMHYGGHPGRFESFLVELLEVLPDSLTLIDGIIAMHKTGPITGKPYHLGLLGCSTNPVALDTALLHILGIDSQISPLWCACRKKEIPGTDRTKLIYPLRQPQEFSANLFHIPKTLQPIRFQIFRFSKSTLKRFFLHFR